jgi:hypothetical protein
VTFAAIAGLGWADHPPARTLREEAAEQGIFEKPG